MRGTAAISKQSAFRCNDSGGLILLCFDLFSGTGRYQLLRCLSAPACHEFQKQRLYDISVFSSKLRMPADPAQPGRHIAVRNHPLFQKPFRDRSQDISLRTAFALWEQVSLNESGRLAVVFPFPSSEMKIGS